MAIGADLLGQKVVQGLGIHLALYLLGGVILHFGLQVLPVLSCLFVLEQVWVLGISTDLGVLEVPFSTICSKVHHGVGGVGSWYYVAAIAVAVRVLALVALRIHVDVVVGVPVKTLGLYFLFYLLSILLLVMYDVLQVALL